MEDSTAPQQSNQSSGTDLDTNVENVYMAHNAKNNTTEVSVDSADAANSTGPAVDSTETISHASKAGPVETIAVPRNEFEDLISKIGGLELKLERVDKVVEDEIVMPLKTSYYSLADEEFNMEDLAAFNLEDMFIPSQNDLYKLARTHQDAATEMLWLFRSIREVSVKNLRRKVRTRKEQRRREDQQEEETPKSDEEPLIARATSMLADGLPATAMRVPWEEFRIQFLETWKGDVILNPIYLLIGEPEMTLFDFFSNKRARRSLSPKAAERSLPSNDVDTRDTPLPERICIHSNDIVDTLLEICEGSVLVPPSDAIPVRRNITILRPFKLLVYHENRIRDFAERLEDKFAHLLKAGSNVAHGTTDNSGETARDHIDIGAGTSKAEAKDDRSSEDNDSLELFLEGRSPIALLHIRCLLNFMDKEINARKKHLRSSSCEKITFSDVWHLFQPGEEVIDQGHKQVYRVLHVQIPMHRAISPLSRYFRSERGNYEKPATVECIYIDFDGERLGPVTKTFEIPRFDQEKPIRSLPIYPFARDLEHGFRDSLVERGKKLWEVIQVRPMHYRGRTIDTREEIDSQVMVDFSEALGHAEDYGKSWKPKVEFITRSSEDPETDASERLCASDCCEAQGIIADRSIDRKKTNNFIDSLIPTTLAERPSLIIYPQTLQEMLDVKSTPTEDELVLMSYRVFGFILRSRKWAELDLTHLEYDNEDNRNSVLNAFDSLILPDGHKDMVQSLVTQHFRDKRVREKHADNKTYTDMRTDLIRGKGQGLVMLLHGAPGVGKTTTAEGIAETFQKPLFQITCGDLGTTAAEVQVELEKNFTLASRWDCILLLDEAEVFLASRERKDLQRNALVAVFLRVLEYYTGILFLTTNRVGDFDEAFASRIQMSLHYPKLNRDKTERIFQINIKLIERKFREQKRNIMLDWDAIRAFALQHFDANDSIDKQGLRWNGRQIRNACQTALAMAEFEALEGDMSAEKEPSSHVHLKLKHFLTVEKAYNDFTIYLGDIYGMDLDERAAEAHMRADEAAGDKTRGKRRQFGQKSGAASGHRGG